MTPGVVSYWCQTAPIPSVLIIVVKCHRKIPYLCATNMTRLQVHTLYLPRYSGSEMFSIGDESQTLKLATEDVNCQHAAKWQEL